MSSDYVSSVLGAALIQGWTMSAKECSRPGCPGCPMMVSRDGKESFCARCDGGAKVNLPRPSLIEPLANPLSSNTRASSPTSEPEDPLSASTSSLLHFTRSDTVQQDHAPMTPPTPQFSRPPSPVLTHSFYQPDPVEAAARRARTDHASRLIGQKLLRGWTLLGDECTQPGCFGIPLMRRSKVAVSEQDGDSNSTSSAKLLDPRKHCVNCLRDYLMEQDVKAYDEFMRRTGTLQASTSTSTLPTQQAPEAVMARNIEHPAAAKKRRFSTQPARFKVAAAAASTAAATASKANNAAPQAGAAVSLQSAPQQPSARRCEDRPYCGAQPEERALESLALAITALSDRLDACCDGSFPASPTDIADHAEALARTCKAMEGTRALYHH